jgi:hypothetical protein
MTAIIASYGGSSDNCYTTFALASSYIAVSKIFYDEWVAATTPQVEAALLQATRQVDSRHWHGTRFFFTQLLEFPRVPPGISFPEGVLSRAGPDQTFVNLLEFDEYQRKQFQRVQIATAEQALFLLRREGRLPHREDQFSGIRSQSRGIRASASFGYGEPDHVLCPDAWDQLRYYVGATRIVRGDAGSSNVVTS